MVELNTDTVRYNRTKNGNPTQTTLLLFIINWSVIAMPTHSDQLKCRVQLSIDENSIFFKTFYWIHREIEHRFNFKNSSSTNRHLFYIHQWPAIKVSDKTSNQYTCTTNTNAFLVPDKMFGSGIFFVGCLVVSFLHGIDTYLLAALERNMKRMVKNAHTKKTDTRNSLNTHPMNHSE